MPANLLVRVRPETETPGESRIKQTLFARLKYTREVPTSEDATGSPASVKIEGSRRFDLGIDGSAETQVADHLAKSPFSLQIETTQGTVVWESPEARSDGNDARREFKVPDKVFDTKLNPPTARPSLVRNGRFVRLDDIMPDFTNYRLFVAAIRPANIDAVENPQIAAVRQVLELGGAGEVTSFEVKRIDPRKLLPASLNALGFQPATIRPDGAFDYSMDIVGDEIAWLWLLLGSEDFAGYQLDALPAQRRAAVIVMLPIGLVEGEPVEGGEGAPTNGSGGNGKGGTRRPPLDFDERQLVDHPDAFSDDPGKFCTPFENPQRILNERRFFTVLRMDQPEIGGQGSLKVSRPILLDLAPPIRMSTIANSVRNDLGSGSFTTGTLGTATLGSRNLVGSAASSPILTNLNAARLNLAAISLPRIGFREALETSIFQPSRKPWIDWVRQRSKSRAPVSADNPIEWDGDPTIYQASSVAGGHILEWRVQWRSNGYSLGNVAQSLTLAPRQTRRITRISWRRREAARRRERTDAQDALTQVTTRARDYTDAVQSSLSEWSSGGSKSRTTGVAGGIGFAMGPVVIGGGAAHGQASSESWQQGGRRVAAAEQQQLRDAIRQFGESVRSSENTIVTEISQEEEAEGVSETLRNVNYCHALTVIYYEVLRHLRVDTSFAGVRECLFVPFSVTPFDIDKALKWRDKLRHGLIDSSIGWALDRLDEVASAWADSDIPPGRRMHHPINHITGSFYIQLSVDRPREQGAEESSEDYFKIWTPFAPILLTPPRRVIEDLKAAAERLRDIYFQREVAPSMATRWADHLQLFFGNSVVPDVDFTLATSYRFGGTVRIDFTAPVNGAVNREQIQEINLRATAPLPAGSVANLHRMSVHYHTDHFDREVQSDSGVRDIITVETGNPDAAGATARFPTSAWEREDLREMIENAVEKLIVHLNANLVFYHKVIWWLMDRDELYMMLDGFTAPYGRRFVDGEWVEDPGRSLASVVERDPMAILGNSLVFRVAAGAYLGVNGHTSPDDAFRYYYDSQVRSEPLRVSLPTEGLYAQALMDKCNACEEHFGSVDWVLTDKDPELELLADQLGTRRAAPEGLTPTPLGAPIIALQNAPNAPDPQGLAGVLGAITNAGAFRDMAGLAGTQANAAAAMTTAASLATNFGNQAAALELERRKQAAAELDKQRASLERAVGSGIMKQEDAEKHLNKLHDQAAGGSAQEVPARSSDELVTNVAAGLRPGQSGTVARTTPEGIETVSVDSSERFASIDFSQVKQQCGFPAQNQVVSEADLREFIRLEAEAERTAWIDPATNLILGEGDDTMFGRLVVLWISANALIPPDVLTILQANAVDPARNYAPILPAVVPAATLNTEIRRLQGEILDTVPQPTTPPNLDVLVGTAIRNARLSRLDDPNLAFWSAVMVCTCVRRAAFAASIEYVEGGRHINQNEPLQLGINHLSFTREAFRRRRAQARGTYHAFTVAEREPQVGDIIVQDRQATSVGGVMTFNSIPNIQGRALHSDVIVEANPTDDYVVTIGGNVGDAVRRRRFPLTPGRRLVVQRQSLFTQEDDAQSLPNLPLNSNDALASASTARIFALLSPVEVCIVIPGTRVDGGVIA
jgi:hypothetical protein